LNWILHYELFRRRIARIGRTSQPRELPALLSPTNVRVSLLASCELGSRVFVVQNALARSIEPMSPEAALRFSHRILVPV
jgi:hypothetical protein